MVPVLGAARAYLQSLLSALRRWHDNKQTVDIKQGSFIESSNTKKGRNLLYSEDILSYQLFSHAWSTKKKKIQTTSEEFVLNRTVLYAHLLNDGLSICDVSEHHALDDGVVFFLRKVLVRHQRSAVLGGWRRIDSLQPRVALDLLQRGTMLGVPLQHPIYQTVRRKE